VDADDRTCVAEPLEHGPARGIIDRRELDQRRRPGRVGAVAFPEGPGVALDHLAEPVQDRLQQVVAGRQAVGRVLEQRKVPRRVDAVEADELVRDPDALAARDIIGLEPREDELWSHLPP